MSLGFILGLTFNINNNYQNEKDENLLRIVIGHGII